MIAPALCVAIWLGILLYKWPFTKNAATAALRGESGKLVGIRAFHFTLSPLGYIAENISFSSEAKGTGAPELTVRKLVVVTSPLDLLLMRKRVERVSIIGLRATLPTHGAAGRKSGPPRFSEIGQVQFEDALIRFRSFESDPDPLALVVKNLTFKDVSRSRSGSFAADFSINKPQGAVRVSGQIGPWDWNQIGQTHISGSFSIPHADLASFGGIEGIMNASGRFNGPLRGVMCDGSATVPDFQISKSSHSVDLSTTYRTTIDGLNDDITLDKAESHFDRTLIESEGLIKSDALSTGKLAALRLSIEKGQIGDVLLLFTRAPQPPIAGTVDLRLNVELRPGPVGFLKRLTFSGDFGIDRGRFTKAKAQTPINHLSESAEGLDPDSRTVSHELVLSDVAGHISAQHGLATLSDISFAMPGSHGVISGTCNLQSQALNLSGRLFTKGKLSSAASGVKAFFLKIVTPFFTKHSVTAVDFTVKGTAQHPKFALKILNGRPA